MTTDPSSTRHRRGHPRRAAAAAGPAVRLLLVLTLAVALLLVGGTVAAPAAAAAAGPARSGAVRTAPAGTSTAVQGAVPRAVPPLDGPLVVRRAFDGPAVPWAVGHRGVDLAAAPGALVRAAGAGRVVAASVVVDRPVVSVEHPSGWRTTYEPVLAQVAVGDEVRAGEALGRLLPSHPGCASPCLHWGLRLGRARYADPLALLARGPARLLPWERGTAARQG